MKKKKKIGQIIYENRLKQDDYQVPVDEITLERDAKEWPTVLSEITLKGKNAFKDKFYIDIRHKNERLANEIERKIWIAKRHCPTPSYDQTVYRYDSEGLHFLWHIPTSYVAKQMYRDAAFTPDDEKELLKYVLDFYDGTLDKLCRQENKEEITNQPVPILLPNKGDAHA